MKGCLPKKGRTWTAETVCSWRFLSCFGSVSFVCLLFLAWLVVSAATAFPLHSVAFLPLYSWKGLKFCVPDIPGQMHQLPASTDGALRLMGAVEPSEVCGASPRQSILSYSGRGPAFEELAGRIQLLAARCREKARCVAGCQRTSLTVKNTCRHSFSLREAQPSIRRPHAPAETFVASPTSIACC